MLDIRMYFVESLIFFSFTTSEFEPEVVERASVENHKSEFPLKCDTLFFALIANYARVRRERGKTCQEYVQSVPKKKVQFGGAHMSPEVQFNSSAKNVI